MIKYVFSDKPLTIKNAKAANAQKIGEALAAVAAASGGDLKPQSVVDAAKTDKRLKQHFEWDDAVAANAHRCDQARELVRCVHVASASAESGVARAYLSVHDKGGTSYRALGEILDSRDLQQQVLAQAERDLLAWEARYKGLKDVCDLVRQARTRIVERRLETRGRAEVRSAA